MSTALFANLFEQVLLLEPFYDLLSCVEPVEPEQGFCLFGGAVFPAVLVAYGSVGSHYVYNFQVVSLSDGPVVEIVGGGYF